MPAMKLLGAAAIAIAACVSTPDPAGARSARSGAKKGSVATHVKAKRFYSARPAPRVHYSRPPRVVG